MQIILVRANPCFFALVFNSGTPVILETHRRTEIVNFITSARVDKGPPPQVSIGKDLLLKKPDGSSELFEFEVMINESLLKVYRDEILSPNYRSFINAAHCGYLEKMQKNLFGGHTWQKYYAVLSNVGLICFEDPDDKPVDVLPIQECQFSQVHPEEVEGVTTAFRLYFPREQVMFRAETLSEFDQWQQAIKRLSEYTDEARKVKSRIVKQHIAQIQRRFSDKQTA